MLELPKVTSAAAGLATKTPTAKAAATKDFFKAMCKNPQNQLSAACASPPPKNRKTAKVLRNHDVKFIDHALMCKLNKYSAHDQLLIHSKNIQRCNTHP
jgi:hypothetical protein